MDYMNWRDRGRVVSGGLAVFWFILGLVSLLGFDVGRLSRSRGVAHDVSPYAFLIYWGIAVLCAIAWAFHQWVRVK
jgi:hypothetical protein